MTDVTKKWTDKATKFLVGKKVKEVRYLTEEEAEGLGWHSRSLVIIFDDNSAIYPSRDDEGNDAGALLTSDDDLPTIPVI